MQSKDAGKQKKPECLISPEWETSFSLPAVTTVTDLSSLLKQEASTRSSRNSRPNAVPTGLSVAAPTTQVTSSSLPPSLLTLPLHSKSEGEKRNKRWPRCHLSLVRSKAVLLLLLWNLVISAGPGFVKNFMFEGTLLMRHISSNSTGVYIIQCAISAFYVTVCLLYPICGLIGDICCGRYRIIFTSLNWTVLATALDVMSLAYYSQFYNPDLKWYEVVALVILLLVNFVGLAGFQANVVQFSADQMHEAPNEQWSAMVRWFVWTRVIGKDMSEMVVSFVLLCTTGQKEFPLYFAYYGAVLILFIALQLVTCMCYKKLFTPAQIYPRSPYGEIFGVINFARKHRYPIRQSALYQVNRGVLSRINYASHRFGGPYSTEAVEDVKSFLQVLFILFVMSSFFLVTVASEYTSLLFAEHLSLNYTHQHEFSESCSFTNPALPGWISMFAMTLLMPLLYEFVINPLCSSCTSCCNGLFKSFGIGMALLALSTFILFVIDTSGHSKHKKVQCMFFLNTIGLKKQDIHNLQLDINPAVLLVVHLLNVMSLALTLSSALKFILAQSPQSMKGLLIGLLSFFEALYALLGFLIIELFYAAFAKIKQQVTYPSCAFGYYLTNTVIALAALAVFSYVARRYKYRERSIAGITEQTSLLS